MINLKEVFQAHYTAGNLEKALVALRKAGASQIDSIKIIMNEIGLSLAEADEAVLNSKVWVDTKDQTQNFRQRFGDVLEDL